jgi:hypothetical protein
MGWLMAVLGLRRRDRIDCGKWGIGGGNLLLGVKTAMTDQVLRDKGGRLLGRISEKSDGRLEGRDHAGRLKGTYDPRTDQTRDQAGRLVGKGNLLSSVVVAL